MHKIKHLPFTTTHFIFQIVIRANGTIVRNVTAPSDRTHTLIPLYGISPFKIYTVQISAINKIGAGPASSLFTMYVDPSLILYEHSRSGDYGGSGSELGYTWLIVFLVSVALILVVISSLLLICRRRHGSLKQKSIGYLAANTAESFHSQMNNGGLTLRTGTESGCNNSSMMNSTSLSNTDHGK